MRLAQGKDGGRQRDDLPTASGAPDQLRKFVPGMRPNRQPALRELRARTLKSRDGKRPLLTRMVDAPFVQFDRSRALHRTFGRLG